MWLRTAHTSRYTPHRIWLCNPLTHPQTLFKSLWIPGDCSTFAMIAVTSANLMPAILCIKISQGAEFHPCSTVKEYVFICFSFIFHIFSSLGKTRYPRELCQIFKNKLIRTQWQVRGEGDVGEGCFSTHKPCSPQKQNLSWKVEKVQPCRAHQLKYCFYYPLSLLLLLANNPVLSEN